MIGALIGGGIGGLIGGYLGASAGSSHFSGGSCGRGSYSIDNYDAMKKELEAIRKNRKKIEDFKQLSDKQQKQIIENTEGLKELLELSIRLSLMTEDEKMIFRQVYIAEEMKEILEKEEKELESRIENILNKKHLHPEFNNRFEHRGYILDLIDACYCIFAYEWDLACGVEDRKYIVDYDPIMDEKLYNNSRGEMLYFCEELSAKYRFDTATIFQDAYNLYKAMYKV